MYLNKGKKNFELSLHTKSTDFEDFQQITVLVREAL
jgi:hypothetical protein